MNDPFLFNSANAAELFLIRHADALPGPDEIIPSGVYNDLPLSKVGHEQALALAERLRQLHFDALYSSPLRRCLETAAPLAERLGLTPTIVDDLQEIRLGEVLPLPEDGQDLAALSQALQERQREIVRKVAATGSWDAIPGSEPADTFRQRVVEALDTIACNHKGGRVLVFAHGGVLNAYAAKALGLERDFFYPAANTSITIVRVADNQRVLYVLNDIGHLKRPR